MGLQAGDKCPSFSLPDQRGTIISIDALIGKKLLVIYFYPKDETSGCTREACTFRDNYAIFEELGCEVIGISSDSIEAHERFAANHRLNFTLLADTEKKVRKLFGVPNNLFGLISGRVTYIIDKSGIIRSVHNSLTDPESHIRKSLEIIQQLKNDEI